MKLLKYIIIYLKENIYLNSQKIFWQQMVVYKIIKLKNIFADFHNIYLLIGLIFLRLVLLNMIFFTL
jgi:hypothetical protein